MRTAEQMKNEKMTFRDWLIIIGLGIAIVVTVLSIIVATMINDFNKDIVFISYKVQKGDNLTAIADKHSDEYVLKTIAQIKEDNNLKSSDLVVGTILKLREEVK